MVKQSNNRMVFTYRVANNKLYNEFVTVLCKLP